LALLVPLNLWDDFMGVLNTLMTPLYWAVSWALMIFHKFWGFFLDPNSGLAWALSVVLLTMVVRTILVPLFVKQINSSRNMQLLQPQLKELQEKYAGDREKIGQETMKLYKDEGVNPMASCLPILLQMPIFIALFWVLRNTSMGTPMGYFTTDADLMHSMQGATLFGAPISHTFMPLDNGWTSVQTLALVLIVAMVVALFITQLQLMRKNMPPDAMTGPMAQQQKMMLFAFPVIYAITGVNIPIGVLVYWLTTNLWTMGQQYILIHNNPAPNTPAYVDWEERMRARGKDPEALAAKRRGVKKRPQQAPSDPTKVQRQTGTSEPVRRQPRPNRSGKEVPPANAPEEPGEAQKQVVRRQQVQRQSRAKRKTQGPNAA